MLDITAISKTFHPGTPNARQALRQLSLHLELSLIHISEPTRRS